jgi:hypothetical protein
MEEEVSAKDQAKIKKKRGARHVSSKQHLERSRRVFASTIESERIFLFRGFSDENWPFLKAISASSHCLFLPPSQQICSDSSGGRQRIEKGEDRWLQHADND